MSEFTNELITEEANIQCVTCPQFRRFLASPSQSQSSFRFTFLGLKSVTLSLKGEACVLSH